jgi:N utilization substance protein A
MVTPSDLASIEGFDNDLSQELINRAKNYLEKENIENLEILKKEGVDDYLLTNDFFNTKQLIILKDNNIKTRDQLADLSSFELMEFLNDIDNKKADEVILESRKHWFEK